MSISFDGNGAPVVTTAPVVEGHTDFAAAVVGSESVDDWPPPAGESANFFKVRLTE